MKQPTGKLKWIKKIPTEKMIRGRHDDAAYAYILDVDLERPKELHDEHSDCSLAPETAVGTSVGTIQALKIKNATSSISRR